ncbi:inverse autotransporter beta-barrel domain-containing protein [Candidatus Pelagibacter ubique]|uniref:inverse autotransporter beta domain-containing protein n=1 Tax=Pelagibacter ubique TaxID=198252 RepID=UPI0003C7FD47
MLKKFAIALLASLFAFNANAQDLKNKATNKITSELNKSLTSGLGKIFPTAEVSLSSGKTQKVKGNILVVMPFSDIDDKKNVTFTQGSIYFSDNDQETLNLGVGQRRLLDNENLMVGANMFFDEEFTSRHRRASFGLEAITSVGSLRANQYYGLSGWKTVNDIQEKALDGHDMEVGAPLPYLPWTKAYYRTFEWEGASGVGDLKGDEMSLEANLPFGLNVEVGKRSNDNSTKDREFVSLTWKCCYKSDQQTFGISDKAYSLTSVADQRFQKVRRQNLIVKQQDLTLSVIGF